MSLYNPNSPLPNMLLPGFPKCGTTSVFDTIARHPQVCAASFKETNYFTGARYREELLPVSEYTKYFQDWGGEPVVLDGTPNYVYGEYRVTRTVKNIVGSPWVLIVVREPADRAISLYSWRKGRAQLPQDLCLEEYITRCEHVGSRALSDPNLSAYAALCGGEYAEWLPPWIDEFGTNLRVAFFDDLRNDPIGLYRAIASWLQIGLDYFNRDNLHRTNETSGVRIAAAERITGRVGRKLRPLARRSPTAFRLLREGARQLNKRPAAETHVTQEARTRLQEYFAESNSILSEQVADRTLLGLPPWLAQAAPSSTQGR